MPNHQHSSQRRQSPQKHEPDGTRSQNHQAGVDAHQPCRRIRFSLPADLRFYNKLPSAVCGHGAASNALFGKMFRARGSAAPSSNRAQSQRQMFFALHHCQLFRRRFQKTENENRGRVWIGQQTRRIKAGARSTLGVPHSFAFFNPANERVLASPSLGRYRRHG